MLTPDARRSDDPCADPPAGPVVDRVADRAADEVAALRLDAGRVGIVFVRLGDRWGHRVFVDGAPRFESAEGPAPAGDDRWPASPVLTEVSLVAAGGGTAIGGVGAAGRSHFSLSISRHPARPDTLLFEAACRIQEPPGWLGSTYRVLGHHQVVGPAAACGPDSRLIRVPAPSWATVPAPLPRTVAWSYVIGPEGIAAQPSRAGRAPAPEA